MGKHCKNSWTTDSLKVDVLNVNTGALQVTALEPFELSVIALDCSKSKYLLKITYSSGGGQVYTTQITGYSLNSGEIQFAGSIPLSFDSLGLSGLFAVKGTVQLGSKYIKLGVNACITQNGVTYSAVASQKLY